MVKKILFIILFISFLYKGIAQNSDKFSSIIGMAIPGGTINFDKNLQKINCLKGFKSQVSYLIGDYSEQNQHYGIDLIKNEISGESLILLQRLSSSIVVDYIVISKEDLLDNLELGARIVRLKEKVKPEIIILYLNDGKEFITNIKKAWRADLNKEKLINIDTDGLSIFNPDFGKILYAKNLPNQLYPTLPIRGKTINDFIPTGWFLKDSSIGDLNRDRKPDIAFVIEKKETMNEARMLLSHINTYPRILVIVFNKDSIYTLQQQNNTFILRKNDFMCNDEDLYERIKIENQVLKIDFKLKEGFIKYQFAYYNNNFNLLKKNTFWGDENFNESSEYNLIEKKLKIIENKIGATTERNQILNLDRSCNLGNMYIADLEDNIGSLISDKKTESVVLTYKKADENNYQELDEQPQFRGGREKFVKFIEKNIKYPELAYIEKIEGRVFISFTVTKDGSVENVSVIKGIREDLNNEAVRVVKLSPKWKPGKYQNKSVDSKMTFPINFIIK